MKPYAEKFYKGKKWQACRDAYTRSAKGLCERCLAKGIIKPGVIVHHKIHLTPDNIKDETVSLNWENLELLCREHHAEEHDGRQRRYKFDDLGRVVTT